MKDYEFLRVIEEICLTLSLSRPTITHILHLYTKFMESETHDFRREIVIVACIYLAGKINEEIIKIRDIMNMVSIVTGLYRKQNLKIMQEKGLKEPRIDYVDLDIIDKDDSFLVDEISKITLEKYNKARDDVLKAEQHLLKILNFDLENHFELQYKLMIAYLDKFKFIPLKIKQIAFGIFNDSYFVIEENNCTIEKRIPYCILLAYRIHLISYQKPTYTHELSKEEKEIANQFCNDDESFSEKFESFYTTMMEYYRELEQEAE